MFENQVARVPVEFLHSMNAYWTRVQTRHTNEAATLNNIDT
jgi:hypothetical protein